MLNPLQLGKLMNYTVYVHEQTNYFDGKPFSQLKQTPQFGFGATFVHLFTILQ
jgi:hypothetical protein